MPFKIHSLFGSVQQFRSISAVGDRSSCRLVLTFEYIRHNHKLTSFQLNHAMTMENQLVVALSKANLCFRLLVFYLILNIKIKGSTPEVPSMRTKRIL